MDLINKFLASNNNKKIKLHVIGDCMVDEDYHVKVTRISPESPNVCVMESETDKPVSSPGGAANICNQLKHFNTDLLLVGFIDDEAECIYRKVGLKKFVGLSRDFGIPVPDFRIPRKKRYLEDGIQVGNRWDVQSKRRQFDGLHQLLVNLYRSHASEADVVIMSDYNKGVFDGVNFTVKAPVIVDPKKLPLERWQGCTVFKPNAAEAENLSGLTDWKQQCDYFIKTLNCKSVVITQGRKGVVGKDQDYFEHYCQRANSHHVVGAGDCFVGVLALAIGHGFSVSEAAFIANEASYVYVNGNFSLWNLQKQSKYVTPEFFAERDYKLVMSNGAWDIIHCGHLECLKFAKSKGDKLVVAVNSDSSIKRLKGHNRPVVPLNERMEMLAALEFVDYVVSFEEDTPYNLIQTIKPDVLVKGADWQGNAVGADIVPEVYYAPLVEDHSTTNIINKIRMLT